jgi:hypothetical protein
MMPQLSVSAFYFAEHLSNTCEKLTHVRKMLNLPGMMQIQIPVEFSVTDC